jgi:hypothetical protein
MNAMDLDPVETVESLKEDKAEDRAHALLNTWVALTVAILATFMAVCQIKDNNICQAMQQAQAAKIDDWGFYQARNLREEVGKATLAQLTLQSASAPASQQAAYAAAIKEYADLVKKEDSKKQEVKAQAEQDQKDYDALNIHDDQFDLSDALLAISISLLALTALTHKRWLYIMALVPTFFGLLMGCAGLFGWSLHPDALTRLLS